MVKHRELYVAQNGSEASAHTHMADAKEKKKINLASLDLEVILIIFNEKRMEGELN